jgi:hypothetical protein
MSATAFRVNSRYVHVRYSIKVQCRIRTCKLQHSGPVLDTYIALNLDAVTYKYVSGTKPECCSLHVRNRH